MRPFGLSWCVRAFLAWRISFSQPRSVSKSYAIWSSAIPFLTYFSAPRRNSFLSAYESEAFVSWPSSFLHFFLAFFPSTIYIAFLWGFSLSLSLSLSLWLTHRRSDPYAKDSSTLVSWHPSPSNPFCYSRVKRFAFLYALLFLSPQSNP